MKKILLPAFLLCVSGAMLDSHARSMYGVEHLWNSERGRWEDYGIKISKDSSLVDEGNIIDFEARGKKNGKLEVFSLSVNEEKNFLFINGYDVTNKINREFRFPLK